MHPVFELARRYGVEIDYADLGDWGMDELRSEYDPDGPVIRLNKRVIENLPAEEIGDFIVFSIAHELYHHREHRGEIAHQLESRRARNVRERIRPRAL